LTPPADEVANGFVHRVWDPHAGQLACPMQPRQRDRVSAVCLHPLARPLRDQRRRDDQAIVAQLQNLAIQSVARRARFEADLQPTIPSSQLLDRAINPRRRVLDFSQEANLAGAAAFRNSNRMLRLCHIERDKRCAILRHGSPSVREARLGPPEQPSLLYRTKGGPPGLSPGT
jgi:hypothetical protein